MINHVVLVGRLTKDLVPKMSAQGKSVVAFTVACNRTRESAEFIACRAYGRTAELLVQYCQKGSLIGLEGSIHAYTIDKDGGKEYRQEVLVSSIEFLETKSKAPAIQEESEEPALEIDNDDLPF